MDNSYATRLFLCSKIWVIFQVKLDKNFKILDEAHMMQHFVREMGCYNI